MPFFTRLWFAYVCFFAVLVDGVFASRVRTLRSAEPALPLGEAEPKPETATPTASATHPTAALQLLGLLQRQGRLVDFLQQDVAGFGDEEVAAAARVVHDGCQKALRAHATIEPVRNEDEGSRIAVEEGYDSNAIKLTGNLAGKAPYHGTLRHRGWRATRLQLPEAVGDHDASILAPAEVEL